MILLFATEHKARLFIAARSNPAPAGCEHPVSNFSQP
jgi:hypothetical protein